MTLEYADQQLTELEARLRPDTAAGLRPSVGSLLSRIQSHHSAASSDTAGSAGAGAAIGGLLRLVFGPLGAAVGAGIGAMVASGGESAKEMWGSRLQRARRLEDRCERLARTTRPAAGAPTGPITSPRSTGICDGAVPTARSARATRSTASANSRLTAEQNGTDPTEASLAASPGFLTPTDVVLAQDVGAVIRCLRCNHEVTCQRADPQRLDRLHVITADGRLLGYLPDEAAASYMSHLDSGGTIYGRLTRIDVDPAGDSHALRLLIGRSPVPMVTVRAEPAAAVRQSEPFAPANAAPPPAPPHPMLGKVDRLAEDRYLHRVLTTIGGDIAAHERRLDRARGEWRELEPGDFSGQVGLDWQVNSTRQGTAALRMLLDSPYFGRFDFQEDGHPHPGVYYIGHASVTERDTQLVYDWRAPVSSLYYQHCTGRASYSARLGTIHGNVHLRRSYKIANGGLLDIFDENGRSVENPLADDMLLSLLQRETSGRMRQIVYSIQAEQDSVIRNDAEALVVQGPAGSGKTVIALHRAAYLLYHGRLAERSLERRLRITAQQVLVLSPNRIFSEYISRVLPDLHEGCIKEVILDEHIQDLLPRLLAEPRRGRQPALRVERKEDHYESMVSAHPGPDHEHRLIATPFKTSPAMAAALRAHVERLERGAEDLLTDILRQEPLPGQDAAGIEVFVSRDALVGRLRLGQENRSLLDRARAVVKLLEDKLKLYKGTQSLRLSELTHLEREQARMRAWLKALEDRSLLDLYRSLWSNLEALAEAPPAGSDASSLPEIAEYTLSSLDHGVIQYEDTVPLLLLNTYYRKRLRRDDVSHVIIDEAQDYSFAEFEYLRSWLPRQCRITIVGDLNQSINPALGLKSYAELDRLFRAKYLELARSYRSTSEIIAFARAILPDPPNIESIRSTGCKPKLVCVGASDPDAGLLADIVQELVGRGHKSIAVLCKTTEEATSLQQRVGSRTGATQLTSQSNTLLQGVFIVPIFLAKGLEFDAVVIHDASGVNYSSGADRYLLHTACTRALHELFVLCSGQPSALLPLQSVDLYEDWEFLGPACRPSRRR